jgi:integrase
VRSWREQARVIFLLLVDTGIRRGEVLGLRWRTVALADPAGPRIRIEETFTDSGSKPRSPSRRSAQSR